MGIMRTLTINGEKFNVTPVVPASSVTLLASAWVGDDKSYSQVVRVSGVTSHTKVDLQPTPEQLEEFHNLTLAFVAENDGGVVTVYAIGDKPTGDHTIQTTLTEVEREGKIRGNTVGTTMPRTDFNQTDSAQADYLHGREKIVQSVNGVTPDKNGNVEITGSDSSQSANGLNDTARALLINILRNAVYTSDQSAMITALEKALASTGGGGSSGGSGDEPVVPDVPVNPEVTLSGISATYSGGDVAVGTAVNDLTGIVVTAVYSDGSTATVTDYTLSGEIAEGENTITVTYQGMTATFTVTGIAITVPDALIDIDMTNNGVNIGTGGSAYNAVNTNGTFSDGKFVVDNAVGHLTVPAEFMAQSARTPWTVAFTIDSYTLGANAYSIVSSGTADPPALYYNKNYTGFQFKLAAKAVGADSAVYYDAEFFSKSPVGGLVFGLPNTEKTTIAFRNDGEYISFWVNGELKAYEACTSYVSTYWASTYTIGEDSTNAMSRLEFSMFKLWNSALSDSEMALVV